MQESQETQMSSHLDGIVGAVSVRSRKKISKQLTQTSLFQPAREKLHLCEEKAKSYSSRHEVRGLSFLHCALGIEKYNSFGYIPTLWSLAEE